MALEFITGMVLFSEVEGSPILNVFVGWIPNIVNIQRIRSAHFLIMFLLIAFFIHYIHSALLVGISERNGEMESIFTGWKFLRQRLVDEVTEAEDQGLAPRRRPERGKLGKCEDGDRFHSRRSSGTLRGGQNWADGRRSHVKSLPLVKWGMQLPRKTEPVRNGRFTQAEPGALKMQPKGSRGSCRDLHKHSSLPKALLVERAAPMHPPQIESI